MVKRQSLIIIKYLFLLILLVTDMRMKTVLGYHPLITIPWRYINIYRNILSATGFY